MRAILIDPVEKQILEVEYNGTLEDIYKHTRCYIVEAVRCFPKHVMYVDEEGTFKESQPKFMVRGWYPLIGYGLIVGAGTQGDDTPATIDIEEVRKMVTFL